MERNAELKSKLKKLKPTIEAPIQREELHCSIVESLTELVCRFLSDGQLIYVNDAFCRYFERKSEELIGQSFIELFPPKDRQNLVKYLALLNRKNPLGTINRRLVEPNGDIRWQEWIDRLIFSAPGRKKVYQSVGRDITEQVLAEQSLSESERQYRIFSNLTYHWEFWLASDGNYVYVSPSCERITGYPADEFYKDAGLFEKILHPDDRTLVAEYLKKFIKKRDLTLFQFRILTRDGEVRWINHICQPVYDENRQYLGIRGSNEDITKHKQAEAALREAHEDLEERVKDRTLQLKSAADELKSRQKELLNHKSKLEKVNMELMETNKAISVLARNIDKNRQEMENTIAKAINSQIMPIVKDLRKAKDLGKLKVDLDILAANLQTLTSDLSGGVNLMAALTPTEVRIATMIKNGMTSQQIADKLFISVHTAKTHRRNIRKKLNVKHSRINLASYLQSIMW